jgi:hypothetical protein
MKKKLLASVLTSLGMVGAAQAVHVNPDGLGQVLLYPYYTVQNGFDTYVHVVNTTTQVKAVKVRFLEGKNSQEVLDFNLYLSPNDEWTGVLVRTAAGTSLMTSDTSCTVGAIPAAGQPFVNFRYLDDSVNGTDRTREGYIELIEMGEIDPESTVGVAATHVNGVPADCSVVRTAALTGTAVNTQPYFSAPAGGLYGFNTLINVEAGMATTIDAVALDNFSTSPLHRAPGDEAPSLSDLDTAADIIDGNNIVVFDAAVTRPVVDNVSALLMRTNVINDYVVAPEIAAMTDWVVTFPTKRFYVNDGPVTPFTEAWDTETSSSCDEISVSYFDREEGTATVTENEFSPPPPAGEGIALCNEVNTISVVPTGDTGGIFGAEFTNGEVTLNAGFTAGWMDINFTLVPASGIGQITDASGTVVQGLPFIGFAAMSFTNGTLTVDGVNVLSNYLGSSVHKGTRSISVVAP